MLNVVGSVLNGALDDRTILSIWHWRYDTSSTRIRNITNSVRNVPFHGIAFLLFGLVSLLFELE